MLRLCRATVVQAGPSEAAEQQLTVVLADPTDREDRVASEARPRRAIADVGLVGRSQAGDEVIVNVAALELGLGSGGFDIVHVNLSRGLATDAREPPPGSRPEGAMKLNYTSLQHHVDPVEAALCKEDRPRLPLAGAVGILALHGQLAPVAWAFREAAPGRRLGFVQTAGGALPGGHSRVVARLREGGLLAGHLTAAASFGGEGEAITTAGAIHYGLTALRWDAVVCGPGPGIIGSGSALGHGGMVALDSAHTARALGCTTLLAARMSSRDSRGRHLGISHHTLTVLDLLLEPVTVALPAGIRSPVGSDLRAGLATLFPATRPAGWPALSLDVDRPVRITRHDWRKARIDLPGYAASGLPSQAMGATIVEDPLFFGAALAAGVVLAQLSGESRPRSGEDEERCGPAPALVVGAGGPRPS